MAKKMIFEFDTKYRKKRFFSRNDDQNRTENDTDLLFDQLDFSLSKIDRIQSRFNELFHYISMSICISGGESFFSFNRFLLSVRFNRQVI